MFKRVVMLVDSSMEVRIASFYAILIAKYSDAKFFIIPFIKDKAVQKNIDYIN